MREYDKESSGNLGGSLEKEASGIPIEHLMVHFSTVRRTKHKLKSQQKVIKEQFKSEIVTRKGDMENILRKIRKDHDLDPDTEISIDLMDVIKTVGYAI